MKNMAVGSKIFSESRTRRGEVKRRRRSNNIGPPPFPNGFALSAAAAAAAAARFTVWLSKAQARVSSYAYQILDIHPAKINSHP